MFSASYYMHSPSTASGASYKRSACIDMDVLRLAAAACCDMGWISAQMVYYATDQCRKDRKHVLTQKVVTLNNCCDIACLTFQMPHITTGTFQSHRRQPTTFKSLQLLKERNKSSVRWKSFAIHKFIWWHFQVGRASGLQFVFFWYNINNQKCVWTILLKMAFLDFPR